MAHEESAMAWRNHLVSAFQQFPANLQTEINEKDAKEGQVVFRCKCSTEDEVKAWIEQLTRLTGHSYITERAPKKKDGGYLFRKSLVCSLSNRNKKVRSNSTTLLPHKHKATGCTQRIYISIKRVTQYTLRHEKCIGQDYLRRGMPCIIKFTSSHNHPFCADSGRRNAVASSTEQELIELFRQGKSPAGAIRSLRESLTPTDCMNAAICPTNRQVYYIHDRYVMSEFGGRSKEQVLQILEQKKAQFAEDGVTMLYSHEPFAIALQTAMQRRAMQEYSDGDIFFTDSTSNCDDNNTCLTFINIETPTGGMPICALFTISYSTSSYTTGFQLVKQVLGPRAFGDQNYPTLIMTDDSKAERDALQAVWPESMLLLCHFHVLQAVWRWITEKSGIEKAQWKQFLEKFKAIVYAETEEEAEAAYASSTTFAHENGKENYMMYLDTYWARRESWCSCYRQMPELRGHHTNNYSESIFKQCKEIGLGRVKQYNTVALMHAVIYGLDEHYKLKLQKFSEHRDQLNNYKLLDLAERASYLTKVDIMSTSSDTFEVPSERDATIRYRVNIRTGSCDCHVGRFGKFCKHHAAVAVHFNVKAPNMPCTTDYDRYTAARVALGGDALPQRFYQSMRVTSPMSDEGIERGASSSNSSAELAGGCSGASAGDDVVLGLDNVVDRAAIFSEVVDNMRGVLHNMIRVIEENAENIDPLTLLKSSEAYKKQGMRIANPSQLHTFLHCQGKKHLKQSGAMISVQPTAKARRAPNRSRGNASLPAGRPAKTGVKTKFKKVSHNLAENVRKNIGNYRKH